MGAAKVYQHKRQITATYADIDNELRLFAKIRQLTGNIPENQFLLPFPIRAWEPHLLISAEAFVLCHTAKVFKGEVLKSFEVVTFRHKLPGRES